MWPWLDHIDKTLFLFLNGLHHPLLDELMYLVSSKSLWIPLYVYFIYLLYKLYSRHFWVTVLLLVLAVALADLISVHGFKELIQRPRPCHCAELKGRVHLVKGYCGGAWSFVSSHAANMFALATLMWLFIRRRYPKAGLWLFAWASLIAYSRIYLGVHYPGDVLGGALLGIAIAYVVNFLNNILLRKQKPSA